MCNNNTDLFGIIFSVIIGIAVAVFFSIGFIPLIIIFLSIALVTSGLFLLALFMSSFSLRRHDPKTVCVFDHFRGLIFSSAGTFVTAIIALMLTLSIANIISVVFIFIISALFSYLIIKVVLFLLCIVSIEACSRSDYTV